MKKSAKVTIIATTIIILLLAAGWVPQAIQDHYQWWQYVLSAGMFGIVPAGIALFIYLQYKEIKNTKL